jgi:hypothetical protein
VNAVRIKAFRDKGAERKLRDDVRRLELKLHKLLDRDVSDDVRRNVQDELDRARFTARKTTTLVPELDVLQPVSVHLHNLSTVDAKDVADLGVTEDDDDGSVVAGKRKPGSRSVRAVKRPRSNSTS